MAWGRRGWQDSLTLAFGARRGEIREYVAAWVQEAVVEWDGWDWRGCSGVYGWCELVRINFFVVKSRGDLRVPRRVFEISGCRVAVVLLHG